MSEKMQQQLCIGAEAEKNEFHMDYISTLGVIYSGNWKLYYFNMFKEVGELAVAYTEKEWDDYLKEWEFDEGS